MAITRKTIEDQLAGLKNTQAKEVHVRLENVEAVLGKEITNFLVKQKTTLASAVPKSPRLEVSIKELDKQVNPTQGLGKFVRADLLEALEEMIEEKGGLEKMFPPEEEKSILSIAKESITPPSPPQKTPSLFPEEPKK